MCGKSTLGFLTNSIMFFGWLVGNVVFGILSDKYGRRKILFLSSSLVCWVAFASSFVPWYWLYATLRFVIGFGLGKYWLFRGVGWDSRMKQTWMLVQSRLVV